MHTLQLTGIEGMRCVRPDVAIICTSPSPFLALLLSAALALAFWEAVVITEPMTVRGTFVADRSLVDEDVVRAALVRAAQDIYRRAGRRMVLGLVDVDETPSYIRLGLRAPATSRCILMHRTRFEDLAEHVGRLTRRRPPALAGVAL